MKSHSLLEGSIVKGLLWFAIPLFFSNLFQTLYNTVDTILVGHFLGDASLAAMGATTAIFELIVGFATGAGAGFGIVAGHYFGAKDEAGLKKSIASSLVLSALISVVLTITAYALMPALLHVLNTPADIFAQSLTYIRIIVLFMTITVFYNLSAGMLRAVGDSLAPLAFLFLSCLINIGLDILFITRFHMGVAGAAWATIIAQFLSTLVSLGYIGLKKRILIPARHSFVYDKALVQDLGGQGLSMGFMMSIVSMGTVILQAAINNLGTTLIAAHTAARKCGSIVMMPIASVSAASSTFVAQNKGAVQYERIVEGVRISNRLGIGIALSCALFVMPLNQPIIHWISGSTDPVVLQNGGTYLLVNTPFCTVLAVLLNMRNALQGLGKKIVPLVSSVIELVGKFLFSFLLIPVFGYMAVIWSEPLIWVAMTIQLLWAYSRVPEIQALKKENRTDFVYDE